MLTGFRSTQPPGYRQTIRSRSLQMNPTPSRTQRCHTGSCLKSHARKLRREYSPFSWRASPHRKAPHLNTSRTVSDDVMKTPNRSAVTRSFSLIETLIIDAIVAIPTDTLLPILSQTESQSNSLAVKGAANECPLCTRHIKPCNLCIECSRSQDKCDSSTEANSPTGSSPVSMTTRSCCSWARVSAAKQRWRGSSPASILGSVPGIRYFFFL